MASNKSCRELFSSFMKPWFKPWWFQLLSMLVSIGLVVSMVFVLRSSNGQPVNSNDETLNAKISALSTANGVFLLLVIGACLSQQNWILFSQTSRCLYDFQTVSDASRGLQGSLQLLFRTLRCGHRLRNVVPWLFRQGPGFSDNKEQVCHHFRGGTIVKIGPITTCLAVAMDPFAQKLISFDKRESFSEASIPYASRYSRGIKLIGLSGVSAWNVSDTAVYGISYYMQTFFASCLNRENCTQAVEDWVHSNGFYLSTSSSGGRQREDYRPSTAKVLWESDDIEPIFKNVAASMSNALRRGADDEVKGKGTVLSSTTVYKVVWPWMTLHCIQEIIALLILVSTICSTHRRSNIIDAWKSSELAVFSKGATISTILGGLHTKQEPEEKAKMTKVDLFETSKEASLNASDDLLPTDQGTPGDES